MKKTSRRLFARQLTAGLASLPVLTSVVDLKAQRKQTEQSKKLDQQSFLREHDTPPPSLFMPGSLLFEANTNKSDWDTFTTSGNRRKWTVVPKPYPNGMSPTNIYIAHVKMVTGAGDLVFHFDNDSTIDHATPIHVTATLKKSSSVFGDIHLTAVGNRFEIDVPNLKKLKKKNNDPSSNPKLRQRVRYMHDNDDDECDWVTVRIDKGSVNLFGMDNLNDLPGFDDMKLMFWWENI